MRLVMTLCLLLFAAPCFANPHILVSIAPIHSLVSALTKGVTQPKLLLNQGGSPHSSSLKPSQALALSEADLFIWIGPELESFLSQPVLRLVRPDAEMQLLQLKNLKLLTQRHGGLWEEDQHVEGTDHADSNINPHIWLSPENAQNIADSVYERLRKIDPSHADTYKNNYEKLRQRIAQLHQELEERLAPIRNIPYLVFHDAYPYFEAAFLLNAVGSIRISAERAPGARRIQQIRAKVSESAAVCLFSEPQFSPTLAETLTQGSNLKLGTLDPLGKQSITPEDGWFDTMRNLANNLVKCLE